jgi:hypothetical protein
MIELPYGLHIEVGDLIVGTHPLVTHKFTVTRVTTKYAFVNQGRGEGKFPRIYTLFGFTSLPRDTWDQTDYTVYREVKE